MSGHSILLVDDEPAIVNTLARTLRAKGYAVQSVENGKDALFALAESTPDVMLLDINLPDLTGWEVLRRLSATDRERVAVIVFSASPLAPSRVEEFHPAGVLVKPFPIDALETLLVRVLEAHEEEADTDG